jgi:hypothetical protein
VHEIAKSGSCAFSNFILPATSFTKVSDGAEFSVNGSATKPAIIQIVHSLLSVFFPSKLDVNIANQVVSKIIANVHFFNFTVLIFAFNENIFKEVIIMLLHFLISDMIHLKHVCRLGGILWIDIQILKYDRLTESGLIVNSRTSISMSAGSNLEVEGTVDFVLFSSKNRSQIFCHD